MGAEGAVGEADGGGLDDGAAFRTGGDDHVGEEFAGGAAVGVVGEGRGGEGGVFGGADVGDWGAGGDGEGPGGEVPCDFRCGEAEREGIVDRVDGARAGDCQDGAGGEEVRAAGEVSEFVDAAETAAGGGAGVAEAIGEEDAEGVG